METVQFTIRDAELLYSFPKPLSDLATVIRCFKFLNRTAAPSYEELTGCLTKAEKAGIIRESAGSYIVESHWYSKIHADDDSSENEIESLLSFEDSFVGVDFAAVANPARTPSRAEFEAAVQALR